MQLHVFSRPEVADAVPLSPAGSTPSRASPAGGSRRRRLWDLPAAAHCPVIGVCLPLDGLRRLVSGVAAEVGLDAADLRDDYRLHVALVGAGRQRGPLAELLQRDLERRYRLDVQQASRCKTADELGAWWAEACDGPSLAGALWAALTHPRCDFALEQQVLGEVHMLQHQVGRATRVERARMDALLDENGVLSRALATAQQRSQQLAEEARQRCDRLETQLLRCRAQLMVARTELAQAQPASEVPTTANATQSPVRGDAMALRRMERALGEERRASARLRERLAAREAELDALRSARAPEGAACPAPCAPPALGERAVLCVGGRPASVPIYRQVVEHSGGRFLHHDGGEEQSTVQLEATLSAADLVICQAGCISHGAYWRVKSHCKRTGKQCVFVETPSRHALERALKQAVRSAAPADAADGGTLALRPSAPCAP